MEDTIVDREACGECAALAPRRVARDFWIRVAADGSVVWPAHLGPITMIIGAAPAELRLCSVECLKRVVDRRPRARARAQPAAQAH
jgi:hypothetical protein